MDRLAESREKRGLTLRELSKMSGVSPDTINQIELGHRKPRPSTLRKLARALDIDVEDFFSESEELTARPKEEGVKARDTIIHELKAEIGRLEYIVDRMRDSERMVAEHEWQKTIEEA